MRFPAPTFTRAAFTVSWTTLYPSLLESADGRLIKRRGYANMFSRLGIEGGVCLPWETKDPETGEPRWSRFWMSYLDAPDLLQNRPKADVAWDHVTPFSLIHVPQLRLQDSRGGHATATAEVLVYPSSVAVLIHVTATGEWTLNRLARALWKMRESNRWSRPEASLRAVSLNRIAGLLRGEGSTFLAEPVPEEPKPQTIVTVAAPLSARPRQGVPAKKSSEAIELRGENGEPQACVAALALLEPRGNFDEKNLLEKNTSGKRSGRVYVLPHGHAIWHADYIVDHPDGIRAECLLRNHTHLVTHIAVLADMVSWAADRIEKKAPVPVGVQPIIKRAALSLDQLDVGKTTYKAELAKRRIEAIRTDLERINCELP